MLYTMLSATTSICSIICGSAVIVRAANNSPLTLVEVISMLAVTLLTPGDSTPAASLKRTISLLSICLFTGTFFPIAELTMGLALTLLGICSIFITIEQMQNINRHRHRMQNRMRDHTAAPAA